MSVRPGVALGRTEVVVLRVAQNDGRSTVWGGPWDCTLLAQLAVEGTLAEQTVGHREVEVVVEGR